MLTEVNTCRETRPCKRKAPVKMLDSDSLPVVGIPITSIDLDLTVKCNLRCDYCFKEKTNKDMSLETAQDAVCWLIFASQDARRLIVNFIGGEPLLRFDLIKKLVPFAKRRAFQHNKMIHFGITTNGTIMSKEIIDFWRRWGIGFHTSIDGSPEVQDRHRHFANGSGSSHILVRNLPKILALRPNTTARATILPDTVNYLAESFDYLINMGYKSIAFVPGSFVDWNQAKVDEYRDQFEIVMHKVMELFRKGTFIRLKFFDEGCKALASGKKPQPGKPACGAGRGMVLIDVNGDIWPCHRWSKERESDWRFGSIYEPYFNYNARGIINQRATRKQLSACRKCKALFLCTGGCPAENIEDTGLIHGRHSIGCALMVALAELIVRFHNTMLAEKNPLFMDTYYKKPQKFVREVTK